MHNKCISNLLNLKGVIVKKVENFKDSIAISIETLKTEQICPHCSNKTSKVHDYRFQTIKDMPIQFKKVFVKLKKRRYKCTSCNKTFYESLEFLPRYYRSTNRLLFYVLEQLGTNKSVTQIAKESNLSTHKIGTIIDLFNPPSPYHLPEVISLDEFKGNTGKYKYQLSITDTLNHKLIDILPTRFKHDLCKYFKKFSYAERCNVKYFVTDLWETYKDIAMTYFPKAKIIADRFHYIRYIINATNNVRIRVQKTLPSSEKKYFFHSKKLLLSNNNNLKDESKDKLSFILINYSEDLRNIYLEKEKFINITKMVNPNEAKIQFTKWVKYNLESDIPELRECARTYFHWSYEIKNSLEVPYSNGIIEGFNNKIKTLKRIAFGFRNFQRFRTRILLLN